MPSASNREVARDVVSVDRDADVLRVDVLGHDDLDEGVAARDQVGAIGEDAQDELAVLRPFRLRRVRRSKLRGLGRCDRVEIGFLGRRLSGCGFLAGATVGGQRREGEQCGEDDENGEQTALARGVPGCWCRHLILP